MKKLLSIVGAGSSYLFASLPVLAQTTVSLNAPKGSIETLCLTKLPQFVIQLLFVIGVIAAVAFLIYGGIKWVISGGDKSAVESARNHIIAAIIGLIIVIGAFFIIGLVFQLVGAPNPVTNLQITNLQGQIINCQ